MHVVNIITNKIWVIQYAFLWQYRFSTIDVRYQTIELTFEFDNMTLFVIFLVFLIHKLEASKCAGPICLPSEYNKMVAPVAGNLPYPVDIWLDVLQILDIDDFKFTVTLDMYLSVIWQEDRLFKNSDNNSINDLPHPPLDLNLIDELWTPDIFIRNLKSFKVNSVIGPFAGDCSHHKS